MGERLCFISLIIMNNATVIEFGSKLSIREQVALISEVLRGPCATCRLHRSHGPRTCTGPVPRNPYAEAHIHGAAADSNKEAGPICLHSGPVYGRVRT